MEFWKTRHHQICGPRRKIKEGGNLMMSCGLWKMDLIWHIICARVYKATIGLVTIPLLHGNNGSWDPNIIWRRVKMPSFPRESHHPHWMMKPNKHFEAIKGQQSTFHFWLLLLYSICTLAWFQEFCAWLKWHMNISTLPHSSCRDWRTRRSFSMFQLPTKCMICYTASQLFNQEKTLFNHQS